MRYLKMLGVVAVATMALAVFAGTALATELYSGATTLKAGTSINATLSGTNTLTSTEGTILDTCTGGELAGKTTNSGSSTETVKIVLEATKITWGGCTNVTSTLQGAEVEWHWLSALLHGTLTIKGLSITIQIPPFGTCVFTDGTGTTLGTLTGSTTGNAVLDVNAVLTKSSGLCASTAKWTGTYKVTSPTPLHVTAS